MRTKSQIWLTISDSVLILPLLFVPHTTTLKVAIAALFAFLAYCNRKESKYHLWLYFLVGAILFSPLPFISLNAGTWNIIDVVTASLLSLVILASIAKLKSENTNK